MNQVYLLAFHKHSYFLNICFIFSILLLFSAIFAFSSSFDILFKGCPLTSRLTLSCSGDERIFFLLRMDFLDSEDGPSFLDGF